VADDNPLDEMDLPDLSDPFGPDHLMIAHMLAAGQSHAEAGMAVGRTAKWVQRALNDTPDLREYITELKIQRASEAAAALGALLPEAVEATQRGLTSEKVSDQLRAAGLVFDQFRLFRSDSATAERMAELREEIDELKDHVQGQREIIEVTGS
jgi:uncharacterized protein YicC (UPF0701 family)